ncbi:MAG: hypothetical protein LBU70_11110 [Chitinispirillales bacterium]|jgi:hypothetical protein|nr:hypothetical protein [Chitinispirillales bacterium]
MAAKKVTREKEVKVREAETMEEPKRLSKLGEWWKANPKGLEGYVDMRAVMR